MRSMAAAKSACEGTRRAPGESRRVVEVGVEPRGAQQSLGRYAAEVQAIAAQEVLFHQRHLGAEGGGAGRGDQPGGACAEDDEVVAGGGLAGSSSPPAACWPAAWRRKRRSAAARIVTRCGRPRSSVARSQPSLAESRATKPGHDGEDTRASGARGAPSGNSRSSARPVPGPARGAPGRANLDAVPSPVSKLGLKLVRSPSAPSVSGWTSRKCRSAGKTISGAKGRDATAAQGARVPSSGPKGTPRAT